MSPEELRTFRSLGCRPVPKPVCCNIDVLKAKFTESKCTDTFALLRVAIKERRDDGLVLRIADSDHLSLVVGEYMLKYKVPADFMLNFHKHIPYIFLAYTTVHNVFLNHFEPMFVKFAGFGILKVLLDSNMDQERLKSAIVRCAGRVEGLEESITKYESFRERDFLQRVSPMISPMYPDLILSIHSILSEYRFCLDSTQAYSVLKASIRCGNCRPDFIQYLVSKLEAKHAMGYQDVEETLIALYSKYRILPKHIVGELADSIEKHYLLTCDEHALCPHRCIPSLHSCLCEIVCSHLHVGALSTDCINGFYFSLHDRNYTAHMTEGLLDRKIPSDCIQSAVFREQILCFMKYACEKRILDMYFCRILRFRDKELTLSALTMLSRTVFFRKLCEIEKLLPIHGKKIEADLMHIYKLIMGRHIDGVWEDSTALSESTVHGADVHDFYQCIFIEYVIYKEHIAVLLQIKSFDIAEHHHKLSVTLLEKYFESRDIDELFIEAHFERYKEVILRTLLRKRQMLQSYWVLFPCFKEALKTQAFRCAVREELFRITNDPKVALRAVMSERDIRVVFEYLRSTAELQSTTGKKRECREILIQFVEKYKHVLQAEGCVGAPLSTSTVESVCMISHAGNTENIDEGAENMLGHEHAKKRHKDAEKSRKGCAKKEAATMRDAMEVFMNALESGVVGDKVLEDIATYMQKHKHGIGFLISTMIAKNREVENMAFVFSALLDRLEPDAQTFYIRNIFSHSRESTFVRKSLRFVEALLCNLSIIETEAAWLFIKNNRHAKSFEFLVHIFQKINCGDIMRCLKMLKHTLKKNMVSYVCRGIYANTSSCFEGERHMSFLGSIIVDLSKDNDELMKIIGLRLLSQNLLTESSNACLLRCLEASRDIACDVSDGGGLAAHYENTLCLEKPLSTTGFLDGVSGLLNSSDDFVVVETLDVLKVAVVSSSSLNYKVFDILHRRAKLDEVGRKCLEVLDISNLQKTHLDRLFQMFYLDALAFLEVLYKLRAFGYELTREMVNELILLLAKTYSDEKRKMICKALNDSVDSSYVDAILNAVSTNNFYSQLILLSILERITSHIDMKIFLRLCTVIPTDKRLAVKVLRVLESKQRMWVVPEKWMIEKLDMLMVWIYPLQMKDKSYYAQLCMRVESKNLDVYVAVRDYYAGGCV